MGSFLILDDTAPPGSPTNFSQVRNSLDASTPKALAILAEIIATEAGLDRSRVEAGSTLESLGIDSLTLVMIIDGVEQRFGMSVPADEALSNLRTVGDLAAHIEVCLTRSKSAK